MMLTHFRLFEGDNETPICGERTGAATIVPDEVTCPQCRVLLQGVAEARTNRDEMERNLEDLLRASIRVRS